MLRADVVLFRVAFTSHLALQNLSYKDSEIESQSRPIFATLDEIKLSSAFGMYETDRELLAHCSKQPSVASLYAFCLERQFCEMSLFRALFTGSSVAKHPSKTNQQMLMKYWPSNKIKTLRLRGKQLQNILLPTGIYFGKDLARLFGRKYGSAWLSIILIPQ